MKNENTIVARRLSNKSIVQVFPDGSTKPFEDKTDWERLRSMTDEEVSSAALSDPDNQPLFPDQLRNMRRVPRTKTLRPQSPI